MVMTCSLFDNVRFGSLYKSKMVLSQFDIVIVRLLVSESLSKLAESLKNNSSNFDKFFHDYRQS